jgi:hypothetical protein
MPISLLCVSTAVLPVTIGEFNAGRQLSMRQRVASMHPSTRAMSPNCASASFYISR